MLLDLSPLIKNRDYRTLYGGQFISAIGSRMTYVALPYQLYHLTGSSLAVGMVGVVQLGPLLFTALLGGAYADAVDRRKLLIVTEFFLALCSAVFALNSLSGHSRLWIVYVVAAVASALNGFREPALNAMIPRLVSREEIHSASVLNSVQATISSIGGPAIAGVSIAFLGLSSTYFLDVVSFVVSLISLSFMKPLAVSEKSNPPGLRSIIEGLKYAKSRQELIGTYAVDFVAVVFGMPMALFPAISQGLGGAVVLGWLYSAPSIGAFVVSVFSRWTSRIHRHGAAVIIAALVWGVAIIVFGYSSNIWIALFFLAVAGAADMLSGIFRTTIWNTTIPDHLRGRLAGVEMVGYMSGPLLGNTESGLAAALSNTQFSVISGGVLCVVGVVFCAFSLPRFWSYDSRA
jgi:MFS family permease